MWIRGVLRQASRTGEERAAQPVSRTQRMQRLAETHTDEPRERLKDFARRVDTWSEKRTNKSFYESWMGAYSDLTGALSPRTRIVMGLVALGFSLSGLYVADWLEDKYPERNHRSSTAPSEPRLRGGDHGDEKKPRFFSISVVDRT